MSSIDSVRPHKLRRFLVIRNPIAGRRHPGRAEAVLDTLRTAGAEVQVIDTAGRGDAERLARDVDAARYDAVVVAAGDGTINEAVNGLMQRAADDMVLGIVPLGTANVLAREIGVVPGGDGGVARTLLEGQPTEIAVGRLQRPGVPGRNFVLMAGAGFDAHVVAGVGPALKRRLGKGAYAWRSLMEILRYRPRRYRVIIDGQASTVASAIATNGRLYAGPYVIGPDADLRRGTLSVCLFEASGRWHVMRYGAALLGGRLPRAAHYRIVEATSVRIEPADPVETGEREPFQVDGDDAGDLPIEIGVAERRIRLLMPAS